MPPNLLLQIHLQGSQIVGHMSTERHLHRRSRDADEQRGRLRGDGVHDDLEQTRSSQLHDAHLHDQVVCLHFTKIPKHYLGVSDLSSAILISSNVFLKSEARL